jgi:cytochrome c5
MIFISGKLESYTGLFDMENSSVTRKLQNVDYKNGRLTFRVERLYDTITIDVSISGDQMDGAMHFGDEKVPMRGTRVSEIAGVVVDHAAVIRGLNEQTLKRGKMLYDQVCAACHGADGSSNLPAARSFNSDEFTYGSDPYSMWKTTVEGAGQMGAQRWLTPEDAYAVIQYIREELVKEFNPSGYFEITEAYLENLPEPMMNERDLATFIQSEALAGSQEYGQLYFSENPGEYGKAIYSSLNDSSGSDLANNALIIELSDQLYMALNPQRMSALAVWEGGLDLSQTKYQLYRGEGEPEIRGQTLQGMGRMRWSYQDRYGQLNNLVSPRTPFPNEWLQFHGHYQSGENIVLSYSIMGRKILELPSVQLLDSVPVIQHTLKISKGDSWRKLILGGFDTESSETVREGVFPISNFNTGDEIGEAEVYEPDETIIMTTTGDGKILQNFFAAGVRGDTEGMRWMMEEGHQMALFIPPSNRAQIVKIYRMSGQGETQYNAFSRYLLEEQMEPIEDPELYTHGGERVWDQSIVTKGQQNIGRPHYDPVHYGKPDQNAPEHLVTIPENYPYTVDQILLPFDNPWGSWIRPTGFDFFHDGRAVISTYAGDVWVAEGIDEDLDEIIWQRIATGLYDPMGVKIKDGQIYVICRDRIMRLNDLNGDGETDFYESFFADTDVSDVPVQAYNFSLETDQEGNFLYAKAGQYTNNDEPGNLIRVSPDGLTQESVAIGFRAPNGVTVDPENRIYVSDNQGTWMPANKISLVEEGGFYGYIPTINRGATQPGPKEYQMRSDNAIYPDEVLPLRFDEPIIWMPQAFDNSPGNGAWSSNEWGPLADRLIWTSFGKGWAYQVLMDEVDGIHQAAVSALPFQFESGTQRAAVNPYDGQYYLLGVTGWDDAFAGMYGSFDRIRYTGGKGFVLDSVKVRPQGVALTFNQTLNKKKAASVENYRLKQWNYRWQERYGSEDWSVKNPDQTGKDDVTVQEAEVMADGRTILLKIPDSELQPVDQMRIEFNVQSEEGMEYVDTIYLTIHKVPD